jgi:two-component system, chemotaxis family, chemotaxis protein CheY
MPAASAIRVMVVDDQRTMRAMIRRALQDLGFRDVRDSPGAVEALAAIRAERVHLILSDLTMPEMDGLQFLEAVRADPVIGRTVFIMLSGLAERDVVQKAAALGVNGYLVKPFAPAALREKIERIFGELH